MNSQFTQRARVYVGTLIVPVLMAACVTQPTQEPPDAAELTLPAPPARSTPAEEMAAIRPEASADHRPNPAIIERRTETELEVATLGIQAGEAETDARPPAGRGTTVKEAVATTPAAPQETPQSVQAATSKVAFRSADPRGRDAPEPVPATAADAPAAQSPRDPSGQRASITAQPESATSIATETRAEIVKPATPPTANAESKLDEEVHLAMIPKPPSGIPRKPGIADLSYDDASLPITLAGGWVLDRRPDPLDGATRCLLLSREFTIYDGYEPTKAQIQVTLDAVLVKTDSNIDTSYPEQGLRVDDGALVAFAPQILNERALYTKQAVQVAMAKGERLTLALGFWPTWPVTRTQQATLDLAGFDIAFAALQECSKTQ